MESYRKYPDSIKLAYAKTKNKHLFKDLNIPRTTIQYWIQNSGDIIKNYECSEEHELYINKISELERKLNKEKMKASDVRKVST